MMTTTILKVVVQAYTTKIYSGKNEHSAQFTDKNEFRDRRLKLHFLERLWPNVRPIFVVNGALQMHAVLGLLALMDSLVVLVGLLRLTLLYSSLKWNAYRFYIMAVKFVLLTKLSLGLCNMSSTAVSAKFFRPDLMILLLNVWICSTACLWPMRSRDEEKIFC